MHSHLCVRISINICAQYSAYDINSYSVKSFLKPVTLALSNLIIIVRFLHDAI